MLRSAFPDGVVGVDVNNDGRPDMFFVGADRNRDGIPDALQLQVRGPQPTISAPVSRVGSSRFSQQYEPVVKPKQGIWYSQPYEPVMEPISRVQPVKSSASVPMTRATDYSIRNYTGPIKKETDIPIEWYTPTPWMERPLVTYPEATGHSFTHDLWHEVLRPVGLGVAAPVAGAGALVGGIVCGTGALVAGVAFGTVSCIRGVCGLLPIGTDYVVRPISYGIDWTAAGMDNAVDKATGSKISAQAQTGQAYDWFASFRSSSATPMPMSNASYVGSSPYPIQTERRLSPTVIHPSTSAIEIDYLAPQYE